MDPLLQNASWTSGGSEVDGLASRATRARMRPPSQVAHAGRACAVARMLRAHGHSGRRLSDGACWSRDGKAFADFTVLQLS